MTGIARRAREVVVVVHVAVGTLPRRHRVRSGQDEAGARMVKRRVQPRGRVVALIAALREIRRDMVRIGRSLILLQVTAHTSCGSKVVSVGDVAIGALSRWDGVHPG